MDLWSMVSKIKGGDLRFFKIGPLKTAPYSTRRKILSPEILGPYCELHLERNY